MCVRVCLCVRMLVPQMCLLHREFVGAEWSVNALLATRKARQTLLEDISVPDVILVLLLLFAVTSKFGPAFAVLPCLCAAAAFVYCLCRFCFIFK